MKENKCNLNKENTQINEHINNENDNKSIEKIQQKETEKEIIFSNEEPQKSSISTPIDLSKNKLEKVITLDTVVYDLFGSNESKVRNYDKISSEIKKVEQRAKVEQEKLKKKISQMNKRLSELKNLNINEKDKDKQNEDDNYYKLLKLQSKKLEMLEHERNKKFNFLEVCIKLKIPPAKRTIKDILRIKTYLDQSKLGINYNEEFTDKNVAEKLIHFLCVEMCYQKFKKDEVIFRIGDPPDSFYSIIFGKVNILKPLPKKVLLTGHQYFEYLMKMRKQKEHFIFNECINNNKNFFIQPIHGEIIHYIYLLDYLDFLRTYSEPDIEFDKVLDMLDIKPEELNIDPSKVNSNYYINDNIKMIIRKIPHIPHDVIEKYSFINDNLITKEVIVYKYKKFLTLETNDYFGDAAIETHTPRNATIIAEEDTDMAYLTNKLYNEQIASEKAILLEKKISSLHSNYFFNKIKYNKFSKKYYSLFLSERYIKRDVLFNEGENIKYIYFIEDGNVELCTSRSMNEIEYLINIFLEKKEDISGNNNININSKDLNKNLLQQENNSYIYSQINSDPDDIVNYLNQKHNNKLIILNKNEDIGLISYLFGNKYITSCTVVSNSAKIHKIDIDYINQMLQNEIDCKEEFFKRMKKKLELLSERLFKINNLKLVKTDKKIMEIKLKKKIEYEKQIVETKSSKHKTVIDYEKLNNILNIPKDNNSIHNLNNSISISNNNSKIFNNNNSFRKRSSNEGLNLPLLSNIRKNKNNYNFSLPSLNNISVESKEKSYSTNSKLIKNKLPNNNNIKMIENDNQKKILSKKNIIEEKMLLKIQKDMRSFSQNKYTFMKKSDKSRSNSKNNEIYIYDTPNKKKGQIYLTQLTDNRKLIKANSNNSKENKLIDLNTLNANNASSSEIFENINQSLDKNRTIDSPRNIDKFRIYNSRSISKNYNRLNTEINIDKNNNKSNDLIKKNKNKTVKKINHPYYNPLTLIKKQKYTIFDNINTINNLKSDYLDTYKDRIKELKNIRESMKNNYLYKFRNYNIKNKKEK